jgi:hypothetical protein
VIGPIATMRDLDNNNIFASNGDGVRYKERIQELALETKQESDISHSRVHYSTEQRESLNINPPTLTALDVLTYVLVARWSYWKGGNARNKLNEGSEYICGV